MEGCGEHVLLDCQVLVESSTHASCCYDFACIFFFFLSFYFSLTLSPSQTSPPCCSRTCSSRTCSVFVRAHRNKNTKLGYCLLTIQNLDNFEKGLPLRCTFWSSLLLAFVTSWHQIDLRESTHDVVDCYSVRMFVALECLGSREND